MSAAQLERLQEHLQRLRLFKVRERLEALLQDATAKETPYADFLETDRVRDSGFRGLLHHLSHGQLEQFDAKASASATPRLSSSSSVWLVRSDACILQTMGLLPPAPDSGFERLQQERLPSRLSIERTTPRRGGRRCCAVVRARLEGGLSGILLAAKMHGPGGSKVQDLAGLTRLREGWRRDDKRVALTIRRFELLHPGHPALLQQARASGDVLVVGVNGDDEVRASEGTERPAVPAACFRRYPASRPLRSRDHRTF